MGKTSRTEITRREFLGAGIALSTGVLALNRAAGAETAPRKTPPNFIVIFIDDMGYQDLGCFGAPLIKTPRIDRMADEGMKLTSFYAQPICSPSRASLLTGCYPMRVGIPRVLFPYSKDGINSDEILISEILKNAGYATACIGKWHLGHHPRFLPTRHGFDYYFGIPYSNDMHDEKRGDPPIPLMRNEEIIEQPVDQDTLTDRYTEEAVRFIRENKDKPFFLYLPHTMVHVPLHVPERFRGKSRQGLYGDAVEHLDWSTGRILDTVKELGLDEDTLVIFTSDNGPWLSQGENGGSALPLRDGKFTCYEGGFRVPCVMRWPGRVTAGSVCSELATTMDFLPTFAALAGADVPKDRTTDGKDIRSLVLGEVGVKSPHEVFFYYCADRLGAVRMGKWKLVLASPDAQTQAALYDLEADVGETTDLSAKHPDLVKRLQDLADICRDDLGDAAVGRVGRNVRPAGMVEQGE